MESKRQQHIAFQRGMTLLERRLLAKAGATRNAYIRAAASAYAESGQLPGHLTVAHRNRLRETLARHYDVTATYFGRLALSGISKGRKSALTPVTALIMDWIRREAVRKAQLISDTDRDDIADIIAKGMEEGQGTREIASGIRKMTAMTPFRAALIARTETHAAATFGSITSAREAEEEIGIVLLKQWLPTSDTRTRPEHLAMAGKPGIPLNEKFNVGGELMDRPGDPGASAGNLVNCLHPDSVIESGRIKAMTRHWYEGKLIVIKTAGGNELSVTPNHPILTRNGWVAAAALKEGGGVISGHELKGPSFHGLDVENIKASVEEIYNSLAVVGMVVRVAGIDVNFHGDRPQGDVDVVNADGKLRNGLMAALSKPLDHFRLACTDLGKGRLLAEGLLLAGLMEEFRRLVADRFMSLGSKGKTLFRACLRHASEHSFAAIAGLYALILKAKADVPAIGAIGVGEGFDRLASKEAMRNFGGDAGTLFAAIKPHSFGAAAGFDASAVQNIVDGVRVQSVSLHKDIKAFARKVFADDIIAVKHVDYRGFVYNAETHTGYYICNGIVNHNCRCSIIYTEVE